jgi:uncharacterized protein
VAPPDRRPGPPGPSRHCSPRLAGHDACLVVFTKPAIPGRVKTRLVGALSEEAAARLHGAFLADLLARLMDGPFDLRVAWALAPGEAIPPSPARGERQEGADLGERLWASLRRAASQHRRVAAVGSDHPDLPRERVVEAFDMLDQGCQVVVGPARDGGYYLIAALREALDRRLFEQIPWSGPEVLTATLERCRRLGLEVGLLPEGSDVDTPEDLERLAAVLVANPEACPRTRALLGELGWIRDR